MRRPAKQEALPVDAGALRETIERLGHEVADLRASRERLVMAADDDRRAIERALHDGPQQRLVALAVNLQLTERLVDIDGAAARELIGEMREDVRQALADAARLAQRIYPPLLEAGGLAAAVRTAAACAGIPSRIAIAEPAGCPAEVASAVYFGCLEAFERVRDGARVTVSVREENGALVFEIAEDGGSTIATEAEAAVSRLRDRVEALGGRLAAEPGRGGGVRLAGSLPLSR